MIFAEEACRRWTMHQDLTDYFQNKYSMTKATKVN